MKLLKIKGPPSRRAPVARRHYLLACYCRWSRRMRRHGWWRTELQRLNTLMVGMQSTIIYFRSTLLPTEVLLGSPVPRPSTCRRQPPPRPASRWVSLDLVDNSRRRRRRRRPCCVDFTAWRRPKATMTWSRACRCRRRPRRPPCRLYRQGRAACLHGRSSSAS